MESPSVFMEGVFFFGAEARGAAGYGFGKPFTARLVRRRKPCMQRQLR